MTITAAGPRSGSLCSGFGGLDDAVTEVFGGTVAWHAQYDPDDRHQYAAQILAHHHPHIPNHGDITAIDYTQVEPVDILTAGFPCQDVSLAGQRAGLAEGTRTGLWRHVARAIRELQPRLVVIENVPGLLSTKADGHVEPCPWCLGDPAGGGKRKPALRALGAVLGDLAALGFDAEWHSLRASDVGACHQRERVFVLAWPADAQGAGRAWARLSGRAAEHGAAAADADRVGGDGYGGAGRSEERHAAGADRAAAHAAGVGEREPSDQADTVAGSGDTRPVARGGALLTAADAEGDQGWLEHGDAGALSDAESDGWLEGGAEPAGFEGGSDAPVGGAPDWGPYAAAVARWERILGRPAPGPTDALGRLNPAFVEWMQGTDRVTCVPGIPRSAQLKALGNGVLTLQAVTALRILLDRTPTTEES